VSFGALPRRVLPIALALGASVLAAPAAASPPAAGELLVGVSPAPGAAAAASGRTIAPGVRLVRGGSATAARLRRNPGVRWVEPNRTFRAAAVPNDPLFDQQWPLAQPDATGVQEAWRTSVGGAVTVAVLDTGVDASHPDLAPNMWRDPASGADGVNVIGGGAPTDGNGHGTAVAGIIGARGNNGIGGTGVAQDARIMAVRVLGDDAAGTTATVVEGMRYALAHGARIINLSLSGPDRSQALEEQIQAAQTQGVLVVAAAGNEGTNLDVRPSYPAAYPEPNVLAVASTGASGGLSSFSNRGAGAVDLAAPGEDVLAPIPGGSYARWSGTSAAAPEVAGAAVLLEAASPTANADRVRDALLGGARRLPRLSGAVATGELDAGAAMQRLVQPVGTQAAPAARPRVRLAARRSRIRGGRRVGRLTLRWSVAGNRGAVAGYRLELLGQRPVVRSSARRRGAHATSWTLGLRPGRWRWRLVALDKQGQPLAHLRGLARVPSRAPRHR
jgi:subtilisin family serine protease